HFVFSYLVHSNFIKIVKCCSKSNYVSNIWSTSFKFVWQVIPCGFILVDLTYHVSSAIKWNHLLEQFFSCPQDSNSSRTKHLVCGKGKKVTVKFLQIHFEMWNRLCAIN